ncbi:MAG: hypothetical protein JXR05_07090 [Flavobacteriaceae bacterium]
MRKYNSSNFFKHTFCVFDHVDDRFFKENTIHFKSKSKSLYSYTEEGVYWYSNHWGRVANCRWRLNSKEKLKNQLYYLGFAKWTDFYSLNETEKQFYISVNFKTSEVDFHHKETKEDVFLFFSETAQKRITEIKKILSEHKWASYFDVDIDILREKIITEYINSDKSLQQIKFEHR